MREEEGSKVLNLDESKCYEQDDYPQESQRYQSCRRYRHYFDLSGIKSNYVRASFSFTQISLQSSVPTSNKADPRVANFGKYIEINPQIIKCFQYDPLFRLIAS